MATGGNMTPSSNPMQAQYDPATLILLAELGRRAGKHTAAHVLSRAALPGAVAARVQTIEHCDWRLEEDRYEFDPELARRMIDQGQYVGFTMSVSPAGRSGRCIPRPPAGRSGGWRLGRPNGRGNQDQTERDHILHGS